MTVGRQMSDKSSGKQSGPRNKSIHTPLQVDKSREVSPRRVTEEMANVAESK